MDVTSIFQMARWRQLSELHVCLAGIQENHEYTSQFASYLGNLGFS